MVAGEGFDLDRLEMEDGEAFVSQMGEDAAFVAAGGFDAGAADVVGFEEAGDLPPAFGRVVGLEGLVGGIEGDIEGMLACIDAGGGGRVAHLRRPCLVSEPESSSNHAGQMKTLVRSSYGAARSGSGRTRSDHQRLCRGWPSAAERSLQGTAAVYQGAL